jgi:hypothetical protein
MTLGGSTNPLPPPPKNMRLRYEPTGEVRAPRCGEWFMGIRGFPVQAYLDFTQTEFPILRQIVEEVPHEQPRAPAPLTALEELLAEAVELLLDVPDLKMPENEWYMRRATFLTKAGGGSQPRVKL